MPQRTTPSFKIYLSSLAQNLVSKLPVSPNFLLNLKLRPTLTMSKADRQRIEEISVQVSVGFSK